MTNEELLQKIRRAQIDAGERVVVEHLREIEEKARKEQEEKKKKGKKK